MITYRVLMAEDLEGVSALMGEWFQENITFGLVPVPTEEILKYVNGFSYVALDGGAIVGFVNAEPEGENDYNIFLKGDRFLRVEDLFVRPGYRGRGIGRMLLSLAEQSAADRGITNFFISSATKDSDAVRRFYNRHGYGVFTTSYYKRAAYSVKAYGLNELGAYRFVVVFARYKDKWLYSRHRARDTYETPGGHIEPGEAPIDAARRELYEETGALKFTIEPAFDYAVYTQTEFSNGQVFYAEIEALGPLPASEMCEVKCFERTPEGMTYPKILPIIFEKMEAWLTKRPPEIVEIFDPEEKSGLCDKILRALPDWFGIEESIVDYVEKVRHMPFFAARVQGEWIGFVALLRHNPSTGEIYVMGVEEPFHRAGVGRTLVKRCEDYLMRDGAGYMTVKTLADSHPDVGYARTRAFYGAMGFAPIEVFPLLWDEDNPCLLMAKRLDPVRGGFYV